jgi:ABC-2 type transport system ATP-binding protein
VEAQPVVVQVRDVSKRFVIRKEKSLKERLVNFGRSNLHKQDFWALRGVNLEIRAGTTVGLIGPNGSGKSTLLKTIGGIIQPTSGVVLRRGRLAALLELGAGFHPDLTGRENVYLNAAILGLTRETTDAHFDEIVEFSGIPDFIDTQVKFYSSGMYVRLAFAVAVHVDPDVLIVDEVLAVGDEPFQRKCIDRIRSLQHAGKTIILVSHSLAQVGELCDRAIVLEKGAVVFDGDPALAIQRLRDDFERDRGDGEDPAPTPGVQIDAVRIDGLAGDGSLPLDGGLTISVDISGIDDPEAVLVGVGIDTPLGQVVWGTNTEMAGANVTAVDGRATVAFRLADLRLGDGQYSVHASVGTTDGGETMRDPHAAVFKVHADGRAVGVAGAEFSVTVT